MLRYDQNTAECFVYTYKEGVLAAVAHDLKLRVGAFWFTVDPQDSAVSASFDPNSIEVVCAMLRNMGELGIPVWCSMWMPILGVMRTSFELPTRAGARVSGFGHAQLEDESLTEYGVVCEDEQ